MSTTETPGVHGAFRCADQSEYSGWLLRAFPEASQSNIFFRAILISATILGVQYIVEVVLLDLRFWEYRGSYFTTPEVLLSAFGLVFTLVLLGQWGARYVELWKNVRPAFDVSDERYDAAVRQSLERLYGRDHVPFLLFAVYQISVYTLFREQLPVGFFHTGFLHFLAVTALYSFYQHTVIIRRVVSLDLVDVGRARPTLTRVADFSVIISLNWFAALTALIVYVGAFRSETLTTLSDVGLFSTLVDARLFYVLVALFLVGVGLLVFVVPVMLLHQALVTAKRERLHAIYDQYETLFEAWCEDDLKGDLSIGGDPSIGLDILEKYQQNVEALSTWPYRLVSVGELALGSVVPTALSVIQALWI